jgi:hypothetical protein
MPWDNDAVRANSTGRSRPHVGTAITSNSSRERCEQRWIGISGMEWLRPKPFDIAAILQCGFGLKRTRCTKKSAIGVGT